MLKENNKTTVLPNGIKIVSEKLPYVDSFSLGFWFNTGSQNENKDTNGISHFTEHMLFKGTSKRSSKKISDDVEKFGGYLNAFTSKEHTCYYGRGMREHLPKVFDVLADMVQNSLFRETDIKKEAGVILDEFFDIEDSPEELIFDKFENKIFGKHPLHFPIIGIEKNITSFKRNNFLDYLNRYYTANNFLISASGNINHDKLVELVEKKITELPEGKIKKQRKLKPGLPSDLILKKDIQQIHVIIGKKTFGYKNKKRLKVNILSNILGEGSGSRLFNLLREKNGLTYQINTFLNSFAEYSAFGVYFSTNEKQAGKAAELVLQEFHKILKNGITKSEFSRAKEYMKGNLIMHLENTTNRMIRMAQTNFYYGKTKSVQETIDEINSITMEDILDVSETLLSEKDLCKVTIGK